MSDEKIQYTKRAPGGLSSRPPSPLFRAVGRSSIVGPRLALLGLLQRDRPIFDNELVYRLINLGYEFDESWTAVNEIKEMDNGSMPIQVWGGLMWLH